jgi:replicative DNA helicase
MQSNGQPQWQPRPGSIRNFAWPQAHRPRAKRSAHRTVAALSICRLSHAPDSAQLSDLRESGSIEQDADIVTFIYRPGYYEPDNPEVANITDLIIAKHRNGPVGRSPALLPPRTSQVYVYRQASRLTL